MSTTREPPGPWRGVAAAVAVVAATILLRRLLFSALGAEHPWVTFLPAVTAAALLGGLTGGVVAIVLSAAVVLRFWWLFAPEPPIDGPQHQLGMAVFALTGLLMSVIAAAMHRARARERRHEAALAESEELFRTAFEDASVGKALTEVGGRYLRVNASMCGILGYTSAELLERTWPEVTHPDDLERNHAALREVLEGRAHVARFPKRFVRKDGATVWAELGASLVRGPDGSPRHWIVDVQDVTARKRAEDALRDANATVDRFFEASPAILNIVDDEFRYVKTESITPGYFGLDARSIVGRRVADLAPEFTVRYGPMMREVLDTGRAAHGVDVDAPLPGRPGEMGHWKASYFPVPLPGGRRGIGIVAVDVTENRRLEQSLRASEARFRVLGEEAPVGIFQTDAAGSFLFVNRMGGEILGAPPGTWIGKGWREAFHPEDRERIVADWSRASPSGAAFDGEYRVRRHDGATVLVGAYAAPLRGDDGRVNGWVGVLLDVTERRALQQQIEVTSRLAAMGTLVAGMAHEMNNPLAASLAGVGVAVEEVRALQARAGAGEPVEPQALARRLAEVGDALDDATSGQRRVARIVKDLATFARPDRRRSRVRLADVVDDAMRWLPASVSHSGSVRVEDAGAPDVLAAAGQIEQVLVHLVGNSARAIPAGRRGRITIRVGPGAPGMARLEVSDDGVGMSPEVMKRIYDPFFTTRDVGQGMGLGLPICHAIVTAHGGTLSATSEPGRGSTFRVELPVAADPE